MSLAIDNHYLSIICLAAVKQDGLLLEYVKEQTEDICLAALKNNIKSFKYIINPTEDLYLYAIKHNGLIIKPLTNQTEKICLSAVNNNGLALEFVKEKYKTKEICLAAVKQNGLALKFVNNKNNKHYENICLKAVKQNDQSFKFVNKDELRDESLMNIISIAIKKDINILSTIKSQDIQYYKDDDRKEPTKLRQSFYYKLCLKTIIKQDEAIKLVDKKIWEDRNNCLNDKSYEEFCLDAISANRNCLKYINNLPLDFYLNLFSEYRYKKLIVSQDLSLKIIDSNPNCIQYMVQTETLCKRTLEKNRHCNIYIDKQFKYLIDPHFIEITKINDCKISCGICYDDIDIDLKTSCNQYLHKSCNDTWILINKTCCYCKYNL